MLDKNVLMQTRKTDKFLDLLEREGYKKIRQESSHMIYSNGVNTLSIPKERELSQGTKRNLVKLVLGQEYYSKG
jgi:predicted RNA binding protein YcfA (HicA-like mRNA interferase family)